MTQTKTMSRVRALALASAMIAGCAAGMASAKTVTYPPEVTAKLNALPADKKAFITDPATLDRLGLTDDQVTIALGTRSQVAVDAYVTALMQVLADSRYNAKAETGIPNAEMGALPLNPDAPGFNAGLVLRPAMLDDYKREPGPFSIASYMYQAPGVPTFAQAPIALRKEDLVAGKVEVAFIGIPLDFSSGIRDGKHGPMMLRSSDGLVGTDVYTGLDPAMVLRIVDYGDITVDYMSVERSVDHVRMMVGEVASTGAVPFIVGGDHALMYPDVAAMVDTYGKGKVGVLQLDAHYEGEEDSAHFQSDTQSVGRLLKDGIVAGKDIVQVGVRGMTMTGADMARTKAQGVRMHSMAEIEKDGWQAVVDKALAEVRNGPDRLFISFDMSVLDSAYAPAAGRAVPNGLTMREAVPLVRTLCAQNKVVGFELLDPAPILDVSFKSDQNANYILHSCLAGMAQRKASTN